MKSASIQQQRIPISRKDALKKAGKYAEFTAAAAVILLAPKQALASSPEPIDKTGDGWGNGSYSPPAPKPSPFVKPDEKTSNSSGMRDSPW